MTTTVLDRGLPAPSAPAAPSRVRRALVVARVQSLDAVNVLALPWVVLAAAFAINLVIWLLVDEAAQGGTGGLLSLYGYSMAMIAVLLSRGFPYLLGMGVTRRDFGAGTALLLLAYAVVTSVVLTGLYFLEDVTDGWGLGGRFFRVPWVTDVAAVQLPLVFALPMVFFGGLTALYAACWWRWRTVGAVALTVGLALLAVGGLAVLSWTDGWSAFGRWVVGLGPLGALGTLAALGVLASLGAALALRRAPG